MTNEELEKARIKADMEYDKLKDNIHHLAEENKQLKERYEALKQEHIDTINRNEEKQQRIDKAIEYIKETELYQVVYDDEGNYFNTYDDKATADLLQILGDKE